jgi:hypothetical protein
MKHTVEEDAPQFATEKSQTQHTSSKTKGKANRLLQPYDNSGEVEEAREQFRDLQMARTQSFAEFKIDFLLLAGLAEIPRASYVDELYNRLTDKLKDTLALRKYTWGEDFSLALREIHLTDTRLTLNARQRQRARAAATSRTTLSGLEEENTSY